MTVVRRSPSTRFAACAVVLASVVGVLGVGTAPAGAAPLPRVGAVCSSRQIGHVQAVGADRLQCTRNGRSVVWTVVPRPRIVLFGDSLAQESADYFAFFGGLGGADVRVLAHGGTAICDWFDDMMQVVQNFRPDAVVLAFSGNNMTSCMQDSTGTPLSGQALVDKYTTDVSIAMWILSHGARSISWVGAPVGPTPNETATALDALYRSTPGLWSHARYVDGGAHISPAGVHATTLPCLFFEPCTGPVVDGVQHNTVRAPDGAHLCPTAGEAVDGVVAQCTTYSSGALRYGLTMLHTATTDLGL